MSMQTSFWLDVRRVSAQWLGILAASVLSGSLLALLLYAGVGDRLALGIGLAVGFVLALFFWVLISRRMRVLTVDYTVTASATVIQIEGDGAYMPAWASGPLQVRSLQQAAPLINIGCYAPLAVA